MKHTEPRAQRQDREEKIKNESKRQTKARTIENNTAQNDISNRNREHLSELCNCDSEISDKRAKMKYR